MILAAIFQKEYWVEVDPKGGSIEGAGWYLEGSDADIKASNPSVISDGKHRLTFKSWSGDSNATTPTLKLPVNKPLRLEASWSDQYHLSINSPFGPVSGSGWYGDQDVASFSIDKPVVEEEETRLTFEGWRGDFAASAHNGALTMDGPKQVEAVWRVEHRLTVESIYGDASVSGWYLEGETTQINITPVVDHGDGTKHVFKKWKGDIESLKPLAQIEIDSPKHVEAEWSTMYLVTLGVMGVSPNSKLNITVNGEDKTVDASEPLEMWIDAGETLTLNATNIVPAHTDTIHWTAG
jgi:hypothetical protein